jgi:hypothetical protein
MVGFDPEISDLSDEELIGAISVFTTLTRYPGVVK